ncbi:MAG: tetratricopeptide repeat protein [Flavisolibacter sp.]
MRKILMIASLALFSFSALHAQKVKDVQEKFQKGKYDEAKEKIDELLNDPKNQSLPEAWYWKGKVYTELAQADSNNTLSYDAAHEAFEAYKKYQELDQKNLMMALEQNVGFFILQQVYAGKGQVYWNQKEYDKAYENFRKALEVEKYVKSKDFSYNNYSFPEVDTVLVRYTAAAAYSAKKEDEAMPYFEKLADAKIAESDYRDIYGLLVRYHNRKGNADKADKYLEIGKELFPDNDYWLSVEIADIAYQEKELVDSLRSLLSSSDSVQQENIHGQLDSLNKIIANKTESQYVQILEKNPKNAPIALDYAILLRNKALIWDRKPTDYQSRKSAYAKAINSAVTLDSNSALASFLLSEYYSINSADLEEEYRMTKDPVKKKELAVAIEKEYENLLSTSLTAYRIYDENLAELKIQDKANFRRVINQLLDYYTRKKNTERVNFYQEKLKKLN